MSYPQLEQQQGQQTTYTVQPSYVTTTVVNTTTAGVKREWSSGLFDCFDNFGECLYACFCRECYACRLHGTAGEPCWSCLIGGLIPLRTKIRAERGIEVTTTKTNQNILKTFNFLLFKLKREPFAMMLWLLLAVVFAL
jgi:Cys-rich protein (TIGR01571 family)